MLSTCAINDDVSLLAPDKYWYVAVFVEDFQFRSLQLCQVSLMNFDLKKFTSADRWRQL